MADSVSTSSDAAAQKAAEQARLRRERREAKIKSGGNSRLDKISGIGGRVVGEREETSTDTENPSTSPSASTNPPTATPSATHADPDEVDISDHFYKPTSSSSMPTMPQGPGAMSESQLRQMMLGMDPAGAQVPPTGMPTGDEDPFMKMMQQMMSGGGLPGMGPGAGAGAGPNASPFAGMMPPQQASGPDPYLTFWRLLHALVALGLGFYIVLLTPFSGTKIQRERVALAWTEASPSSAALLEEEAKLDQHKRNFFWAFATAEAVLLTTRFFLDKGRAKPTGFLWTILSQVPEPIRGYISTLLRYGQIFTTVRTDILFCMFVLGACTWWRS